ncbi:NUDIX hydrolase 6-like protein [Tanacetum coccineum]
MRFRSSGGTSNGLYAFLKELWENTFSGSDNEDANEHIEKVLKIVDLFHVPNITVDQLMAPSLPLYPTTGQGKNVPTRQILDSRGVVPTKTATDAKMTIQEMAEYSQKWHNGTSRGRRPITSKGLPTKRKMGKTLEEHYFTRKFGGPFQGGGYRATAPGFYQRNNANPSYQEQRQSVLQERGFGSLPSSTKTNPRDQVKSISTTIEADSHSIHRIGSSQYAISTGQNSKLLYKSRQMTIPFSSHLDNQYCKEEEEGNYGPKFTEDYGASHINNVIPQKEKDPGSFTLPCFINNVCFDNALIDLGASVSVMPLLTYLNLGLGELAHTKLTVELANRTVKYPKGIAENAQRYLEGWLEYLMDGLSNDHQLKGFNSIKDAKMLMEAVEKKFWWECSSKKTQRNS